MLVLLTILTFQYQVKNKNNNNKNMKLKTFTLICKYQDFFFFKLMGREGAGEGKGGGRYIQHPCGRKGGGGELFTSAMESKDQSALKKRWGLQFYG